MYYGQINYKKQMQGIPPCRYTISQIGCFLTAFCNLLADNNISCSPLELNAFFRDRRVYIDSDDGIRDDLYWGAIARYAPDLSVSDLGVGGMPPHANSIVKLSSRNTFGTHFCKVHSIVGERVKIIDSWDGVIKDSRNYGRILGWASYSSKKINDTPRIAPTYRVKSSDNDGLIAAMSRIGLSARWKEVAKLNGLRPPYVIRSGQVLKLPDIKNGKR